MAQHAAAYGACPPAEPSAVEDQDGSLPDATDSHTYSEILARLPELRADPKARHQAPKCELDPLNSYVYQCTSSCFRQLPDVLGDEGAEAIGGYSEAEMKLRMDMSAGKVCWSGKFRADLWEWTRNVNPVIALFCSHPLHPVSRAERVFITVLHALFILMISSATPRAKECVRAGLRQCRAPGAGDDRQTLEFCCLCTNIGLSWFVAHVPFWLGGALYAAVVNNIFAQLMYRRVRRCWELLGHVLMFLVLIAMVWPTWKSLSWNVRTGHLGHSIAINLLSMPFSVLGTTAIQTLEFAGVWCLQAARDVAGGSYGEFYVTASDYRAYVGTRTPEGTA